MKRMLAALLALLILPPVRVCAAEQLHYAAALAEAQTGTLLCGTDADVPLPAGTQTKLMTVYVTAEAVEAGTLSPDTLVTVPAAAERYPGATVWLRTGEQMTVTDLLKAVIIGNANDACITLAHAVSGTEQAFADDMNAAAFSLGMRQTRFADCTGTAAENRTTAGDLALLGCALLRFDWLTPLFTCYRDTLRDGATELVSENRLTRGYEGLLGLKAGHGDGCGYTLTLAAERDGLRLTAAVLGAADTDARFTDAKKLLAEGFAKYTVVSPDFSAEYLRPLPVRGGITDAVLPEAAALLSFSVPKGGKISTLTLLPVYAEAPVRRGQRLGTAAFFCDDTLLCEIPLTAAESVPERGLRDTARMLLKAVFGRSGFAA